MSDHIGAKLGDFAETVFLTGDPLRAEHVAKTHLSHIRCVNRVRNMFGFTGEYEGKLVSIQSVGMGMPSMSIYASELIQQYGVKTLIRLGTAGACQEFVRVGDIVLAMAACTDSNINKRTFGEIDFSPVADYRLLKKAYEIFSFQAEAAIHVGAVLTTDTFYQTQAQERQELMKHGVLAVEMETAALYTIAMRHRVRALSVLKISDCTITGESTPAEQREYAFVDLAHRAFSLLEETLK